MNKERQNMASTSQSVAKYENLSQAYHEKNENWSRSSRNEKKLSASAATCYKMTDFYSSKVFPTVLQENAKLKLQIENLNAKQANSNLNSNNSLKNINLQNMSSLLLNLVKSAEKNIKRSKQESEQLSEFLSKRSYARKIWISEDGTRIVHRAQYDASTNQIVGFVSKLNQQGLPEISPFPANSAVQIGNYFETYPLSNYAYCIIAQPLIDKSPTVCVALFGSNNKFEATDVAYRWKWMTNETKKHHISILGFFSDGDTRLLKCMQNLMFSEGQENNWMWFKGCLSNPTFCVQDHLHIGTRAAKPQCVVWRR